MSGGSTLLTWSSLNATTCAATGGWTGNRATTGTLTVGPLSASTTFSLSCTGSGGTASRSVTVGVQPATGGTPTPAPTVSLSASATSVASGGSANLTWSSQNASSCTASGGWSGTRATSGTQGVGPLTANATYALSCTGSGGSASRSLTVSVQSGTGGGAGTPSAYTLLYDPTDHINSAPLAGSTVARRSYGWVYLWPETNVSSVTFYIDGSQWHTERNAPYDLVGSKLFYFGYMSPGSHTMRAVVTTTSGQRVTQDSVFTLQ